MPQHYTHENDATHPTRLTNIETFYLEEGERIYEDLDDDNPCGPGWFYWFCFPGCLPDSEARGPFDTEEEALQDARGMDE